MTLTQPIRSGQSVPLVLTQAGVSQAIQINRPQPGATLVPGIFCYVSAGASLTYTVEITSDPWDATGNLPSPGNWMPFDVTAIGQTASQNWMLNGMATAFRVNITSYTSGSLTFDVVQ